MSESETGPEMAPPQPKRSWFPQKRSEDAPQGPNLDGAPEAFQQLVRGLLEKLDVGFNHLTSGDVWQTYARDSHSMWIASYVEGHATFVVVETFLGLKGSWKLDEIEDLADALSVDEQHRTQADEVEFAARWGNDKGGAA